MEGAKQRPPFETDVIHPVDAFEGLQRLPDESIDCVVTSPPYWGLRDYGVKGQAGLEEHPQQWVEKMVALCRLLLPKLKKTSTMWWNIGETYFGGNNTIGKPSHYDDLHQNANYPSPQFYRARNKLRSSWLQPKQILGLPWRFAIALQQDGWILRNAIIWHKPNHMPSSVKDRFASSYEYVFFFAKNRKYWFDLDAVRVPCETFEKRPPGVVRDRLLGYDSKLAVTRNRFNIRVPDAQKGRLKEKWGRLAKATPEESAKYDEKRYSGETRGASSDCPPAGKNPGDVWRITTKPHPFAHFAVFPEELPRRCVQAGCPPGGIVLDPFMGSGTTAIAALKLKRHFIGFELNTDYVAIAHHRIEQLRDGCTDVRKER